MATLYEHERAELALGAHIPKYLQIFATRNVLDILRQRDLDIRLRPLDYLPRSLHAEQHIAERVQLSRKVIRPGRLVVRLEEWSIRGNRDAYSP